MRKLAIVVALDLETDGEVAFDVALELSARHGAQPLHVVYVLGGYDPGHRLEYAYEAHQLDLGKEREKLAAHVDEALARYRGAHGEVSVSLVQHVLAGPAAKEIARVAQNASADLVVVGTHGKKGVKRLVLGSVAETVLREAHCPVLVARPKAW